MDVILANPRGFCAGVERAIAIVERAIEKFGAPIYVRHEVVHNRFVCDDLRTKGAIFIEDLSEVPAGQTVIFSAHGVSKSTRREAAQRGLIVFDATCPLVTKVHKQVTHMRGDGMEIVMIGHRSHPEVEGTMGQCEEGMHLVETISDVRRLRIADGVSLAYVTQTTLSADDAEQIVSALKRRFPGIVAPQSDDICYATQNRQDAVKKLAEQSELIIVVGSQSSSNSNRLREVAELRGVKAYLVDEVGQIDPAWLKGVDRVGITAGASAPEILVQRVIDRLTGGQPEKATELEGVEEHVTFGLPEELQE
ncbi:MAG: 4-hydroxy-3-methylbut-2-enyl diphosphate reductase [Candidatus Accumulibacter sp.]|jgi:4-hydroxy-3-methylbut-2-enyl diphosphate reductase|nr:4-hydroxy-3-methylbut-2-enyl diphosphate reductase [Accumulibacter sp.]